MRLIDADNIYGAEDFIKLDKDFNAYVLLNDLCKIIDIQPTAYDVDKVIEQLNNIKKYNLNLADIMLDIQANGTNRHFICLEDAIEIIKAGGNLELSEHSESQGNRTGKQKATVETESKSE